MARLIAISVLAVVGGCFWAPIDQRPTIAILPGSGDTVFRGALVDYVAIPNDPDGDAVTCHWSAYACTDALGEDETTGCDQSTFTPATDGLTFSFRVPTTRSTGTPVMQLRIVLDATDDLGAMAKPSQQLIVPVSNAPPDLELRPAVSRYDFVIGAPVQLFAKVGDPDDGPAHVLPLDWLVFTPATDPTYTLTDLAVAQDPADPLHLQSGKLLVPAGTGDWDVQVTATDPVGAMTSQHVSFTVVDDHPPCLRQLSPIVPTGGATLPIGDPTLFEAAVVDDDLDPYPSNPNDPILGATTFVWSLEGPGGTSHVALPGATGNSVELDPATYTPGDIVELRVEIYDRNATVINCPDATQACSVISQPSCLQRQTWRVEIR